MFVRYEIVSSTSLDLMNNVDICKPSLPTFWGGGPLNPGGGPPNPPGGGPNCWGADPGGRPWRGWAPGIGPSCCWNNESVYDYRYNLFRCMTIALWSNQSMVAHLKLFWLYKAAVLQLHLNLCLNPSPQFKDWYIIYHTFEFCIFPLQLYNY